jgi:hypothetical protein
MLESNAYKEVSYDTRVLVVAHFQKIVVVLVVAHFQKIFVMFFFPISSRRPEII